MIEKDIFLVLIPFLSAYARKPEACNILNACENKVYEGKERNHTDENIA